MCIAIGDSCGGVGVTSLFSSGMASIFDGDMGGLKGEVWRGDCSTLDSSSCVEEREWGCWGGVRVLGLVLTFCLILVEGERLSEVLTEVDDSEDRLVFVLGLEGRGLGERGGPGLVEDLCWKGVGLLLSELSSESIIRDLLR